jgi:hypothetical protein
VTWTQPQANGPCTLIVDVHALSPDPTSVTATPASTTEIDVAWAAAAGTTAGYKVVYQAGATPPASCAVSGTLLSGASTTSHRLGGLQAGAAYAIRVCSYNTNPVPDLSDGATASATTHSVPTLSYAGATGTTGIVGTAMSVSPTTLTTGGGALTGCAIKTATTALPAGLSIDAATCVISGTPSASAVSATYTLQATNAYGTSSDATVTLAVGVNVCDSGSLSTTCTVSTVRTLSNNAAVYVTGDLLIVSGGQLKTAATERASLIVSGDVTVQSGGSINANLDLLSANTMTVASGGSISANLLGYQPVMANNGAGPGGGTVGNWLPAAGGSHGAMGASGRNEHGVRTEPSAGAYGSSTEPTTLGSAGGDFISATSLARPAAGGGAIKIVVASTLAVNGSISANGGNGTFAHPQAGGGGAGGSVWIQTASISGSGSITANGGNGGNSGAGRYAGGGSGGRIALVSSNKFLGSITVNGGSSVYAAALAGSYHQQIANICDSGSLSGICTISSLTYVADAATISGSGALVIGSGGELKALGSANSLTLQMTGDVTVESGGSITANFSTLSADTLTVASGASLTGDITSLVANDVVIGGTMASNIAGSTIGNLNIQSGGSLNANGRGYGITRHTERSGSPGALYGGGGTHAGSGGRSSEGSLGGSPAYGDSSAPTSFGSSGGAGNSPVGGGAGGGAIKLNVSGTLTVNGTLAANGGTPADINTCTRASGGGSGGSLWVIASTGAGNGTVSTSGGAGNHDNCNTHTRDNGGGGGGGGRIKLDIADDSSFAATVTASGGARGVNTSSSGNGSWTNDSEAGSAGSVVQ